MAPPEAGEVCHCWSAVDHFVGQSSRVSLPKRVGLWADDCSFLFSPLRAALVNALPCVLGAGATSH